MTMDIYVLNKDFESVAVVDSYESLIWTDRYDEYGDFEIVISPDSPLMEFLIPNSYLWRKDSEHVMIIKKVNITTDAISGSKATISGESLESILKNRVIAERVSINEKLQNGIKKLITNAIISPSNSSRRIPNFVFRDSTDSRITNLNLEGQYFGENLYDAVAEICTNEHVGFKVTLNDSNQFVFELYMGLDHSYDQSDNIYIVFSPYYDNLVNSEYSYDITNVKNVAYICGEEDDDSGNKQIVAETGTASGLNRREIFVNGSSLKRSYSNENNEKVTLSESEYRNQLVQKGDEELAEYYEEENFDGQIASGFQWELGKDFFMGDIIHIENEYGKSSKARIVEMITSDSTSGLEFYPSFENVD